MKEYQVVIIAGGEGSRLMHRTKGEIPKALLKIGKKTLLDYRINFFQKAGFKRFVFLISSFEEKIKETVKKHDIDAKFSVEKEKLGKGGALKYALENGCIDRKTPCVITYPDDLFFIKDFPKKIMERHLEGLKRGCKATIVFAEKTQHKYGIVEIDGNGVVTRFEEKPIINVSATVGVYVLEPETYEIIDEKVDLNKKPIDFEKSVLPEIVKRHLAFGFPIPLETWIPVNEEKEFLEAERRLKIF